MAVIGNSQLKYSVIATVPPGCKQPLIQTASLGKTTGSSPALHFASFGFGGEGAAAVVLGAKRDIGWHDPNL